jgi:hypothetical protein
MRSLEDRMGAVEKKIRESSEKRWQASSASPFEIRLREKVAELEQKLERAKAAGRPTDELEQQLATQREWLAQAGGGSGGGSAAPAAASSKPEPAKRKSTSGWVRADA